MKKTYERLTVWTDPFDIMCGECQEHTYETWNPVTDEDLKTEYEMDRSMPLFEQELLGIPETFEAWLEQNIQNGYIRFA